MPHARLRTATACLFATLVLLFAGRAKAQTATGGTIGTVGSLNKSDFTFYLQKYDKGQKAWIQMNTTEQTYFFNRARCECDGDLEDYSGYFRIAIQPSATAGDKIRLLLTQNPVGAGTARLYAGGSVVNCLAPSSATAGTYSTFCVNLIDPSNNTAGITGGMAAIAASNVTYSEPIPVAWLFNAATSPVCSGSACDATENCTTASAQVTIFFWAQTTALQTPDISDSSFPVNLVGKSAFVPDDVTVDGGNEALAVSWGWPNGLSPAGNNSFLGVQIFCVRGADNQVFESDQFGAAFMSSSIICPNIAPASSSTGILNADPNYLCSGLLPSTSTSYRIKGLQNGIQYGVAVAAIDKYYNASVISNVVYGTPIPTVDFYNEYKNSGGAAQGGFCAMVRGRAHPGLLSMICLAGLGILLWRRRKRRRPGAGPLALLVAAGALAPGQARAQAVLHDDMAITDLPPPVWSGTPREYAIEARFGLYTPGVDSEFSGQGTTPVTQPQSLIFGSQKRPMWQIEFDWEFLQAFGTLSLGGVAGYYKENAHACLQTSLANACERSGDNTSLRLIPLAALIVYRFDVLAMQWKIPIVPYGKAGLNYTIWTVTNGDGDVASSPDGGRGQGGTAGWQAAIGISLQLDFLDPAAARGFDADAGVNHTYAFFELDHIDASGLGSKNVLHVGDSTWFAGLMFEF